MKIRFQHFVMVATTVLVVSLAVALLATVFRSFSRLSEENAMTRFSLISGQASGQLERLVRQNSMAVITQARTELSQFVEGGRINQHSMVSTLLSSLEEDAFIYSRFFGLGNEEFLQVIGIRGDARIIAALNAPQASYFAIRHITRGRSGERIDRYCFLDKNRQELGVNEQKAGLLPTNRPWYGSSFQRDGLTVTDPYLFASNGELGITVATPLPKKVGVLGTDISLRSLQTFIMQLSLPPNGSIAVQDRHGNLLAFHGKGDFFGALEFAPMMPPEQIDNPYLGVLRQTLNSPEAHILSLGPDNKEKFVVTQHQTEPIGGTFFRIMVMAPLSDFSGAFLHAERDVLILTMLVLLILLPLAFVGSQQISRSLAEMANHAERLKRLDFSQKPQPPETFLYEIEALGEAQSVMQEAIQKRTEALSKAQEKLALLIDNGILLAREQNRMVLLKHILFGAREIAQCAAVTLFLRTEQESLCFALRTSEDPLPTFEIPLFDESGIPNDKFIAVHVTLHNQSVVIDDVSQETRFDLSGTREFGELTGFNTISMLTVPLCQPEGKVIGALQLLNALDAETGAIIPFPEELVGFVETLAAQSAVALENQFLIETQRGMMESLIRLIAGAIDAKSRYTGGHCERVPELSIMLAEAACSANNGPLADFPLKTDDEWSEFRIGAWLHDCGKVTTPEFVVDKASKLEIIYNRIHEIRTRFEVLLRDAHISRLEAIAGGVAPEIADTRFAARKAQLLDDFAFVAECNKGTESMSQEKIDRLRRIADETWLRHFDDRLGLAHEELHRYPEPPATLPVEEKLLADKAQHIIPRNNPIINDPRWGFKVDIPEHLYNHGEIYNLSVKHGTITAEERFKINEHVMQSLIMLKQLPLPKNMQRIPEYAATHHETLIGSGYPRKLTQKELSIPMRIIAIADIFEALTASDRPYKETKPLSESIRLLSLFKQKGNIDPELFDLFLTSGVYQRYAEKFLRPEQIDAVDISRYIG